VGATSTIRIARAAAFGVAALIGSGLSSAPARAAFTVTLEQEGSDVVATGSGSIDTAGLNFVLNNGFFALVAPALAEISTGPVTAPSGGLYMGFTGPGSFGGGGFTFADSGSGDLVGILGFDNVLRLPAGYVSGTALSDTATYDNATLASLGATPGTYTWTWGSGPTADSFVLQVGPVAAVPEPGSLPLLVMGLASLGLVLRTRRA
jgi:hypothetical protein